MPATLQTLFAVLSNFYEHLLLYGNFFVYWVFIVNVFQFIFISFLWAGHK